MAKGSANIELAEVVARTTRVPPSMWSSVCAVDNRFDTLATGARASLPLCASAAANGTRICDDREDGAAGGGDATKRSKEHDDDDAGVRARLRPVKPVNGAAEPLTSLSRPPGNIER